ncbi:hypothetical protein [Streptomyces sp. CB01881]|uniref:hypothetical protein n=1 Tax=Streptomyces sp. CB01881 TaxID=2078691 RepID=UPI000CDC231A|nr:hypothetical protein [Streptomyces sp. CB01881]AUY53576.1 hypothetical protein C2142_37380 [Streptomyces sp. CB01881]TYC69720.1 hypothetical protein EH183_37400 [Streptomyces sp. CB01881]
MSTEPGLPTATQYRDLRGFVKNIERQAELERMNQGMEPTTYAVYSAWMRMAVGYVALLGNDRTTPQATEAAARAWGTTLEMLEFWRNSPLLPESLRAPVAAASRYR